MRNRLSYISNQVDTDNWNHVVSHHNPGDLASRGMSAKELSISDIWWKGLVVSCFKPNNRLETLLIQVNIAQTDTFEVF